MKGFFLRPHLTSTRTICSCLSLWERCSGKPSMRYSESLKKVLFSSSRSERSVVGDFLTIVSWLYLFVFRALWWTSRLPPSSSVKSWVTTTALSIAPLTSFLLWTQSFTRTSLPSRSEKNYTGSCSSQPHIVVFCFLTSSEHFIFDFSALWWRCRGSRPDVILRWGCHGAGKDGKHGRYT